MKSVFKIIVSGILLISLTTLFWFMHLLMYNYSKALSLIILIPIIYFIIKFYNYAKSKVPKY